MTIKVDSCLYTKVSVSPPGLCLSTYVHVCVSSHPCARCTRIHTCRVTSFAHLTCTLDLLHTSCVSLHVVVCVCVYIYIDICICMNINMYVCIYIIGLPARAAKGTEEELKSIKSLGLLVCLSTHTHTRIHTHASTRAHKKTYRYTHAR